MRLHRGCKVFLASAVTILAALAQQPDWGPQLGEARKLADAGRPAEGRRLLLALLKEIGEDPPGPKSAPLLGAAAVIDQTLSLYSEAEVFFRRAIRILEAADGPRAESTIITCENLAAMYIELGRTEDAEPLLHRVLAARLESPNPSPGLAEVLDDMGSLRALQHKRDAASYFERALDRFVREGRENTVAYAMTLNHLSTHLAALGRQRKALPLAQRSLEILNGVSSATPGERFAGLGAVALIESRLDPAAAEVHVRAALAMAESVYGPDHLRTGWALYLYAGILRSLHRAREAAPLAERAARIRTAAAAQATVHVDALLPRNFK